ncbi:AfsR/SARP family transcriptional regulator [Nonomuraea rubra]|uniref:DNA-binding SARP family transcriptional activator/tetratricopeptide (TPR) repeat protein n=1 Tax=Nonomuraea rubra TaxID=46180 RepID=A0A7X0NUB0_9ACTN|nr:tetratricopeptide repeat protein [Nonomuraea rubra]MBB6549682.1 DNA-binding SARP family transcriptional activator/tetratricopeptide (TPR) repeat protein [Nonomuraea rubra]
MAEFRLLGPVELVTATGRVDVGPPQRRSVLAALLADAGRPVPVETLVDRVWGEQPPDGARRALHSHVARIRRMLERAGDGHEAARLVRRSGGYVLEADPERVDLHLFRRLVEQARGSDTGRLRLLRDALALWRGEPLAGIPGAWAARVRESLRRQHLDAVVAWADAELQAGDPGTATGRLRDLLAEYPLVEPLAAALMRALHAAGSGAEALACYAAIRMRLSDELGTEPGAELRQLHEAILRDEPRRPPPRRPGAPALLPLDVRGFTGRDAELARLDAVLAETAEHPTAVIISALSGTAGVGKTALAVRWAHRVRDAFPDGQLYVNLRGYDTQQPMTAGEALAGLLSALGVPAQDLPPQQDDAAARYRSEVSGRRMLILLDNASSVEQVRPLLPGSPSCVVMVTSRDSLAGLVALHGACRLDLDLLSAADATLLLRTLIGARADAEPGAAAALAGLCARLPLALRVAAEMATARPAAPLADLVAELADERRRLDLLNAGGDPRAAVRAVFSWSYQRLPAGTARVFRLLGLHPGSDFDADGAAALAGVTPGQAVRVLEELAGAHLVERRAASRYAFHDLLRLYARERALQEEHEHDRQAAAHRLYDHHLRTADAAARLLYPEKLRLPLPGPPSAPRFAGDTAALAWLEAERGNLLAVAQHTAEHGPRSVAWRLTDILRGYFWLRMYAADWLALAHAGLADARADDAPAAQAAAELSLADAYLHQTRFEQAAEHYTNAAELFQQAGWPDGQAAALGNLSSVYFDSGRLGEAAACLTRALAVNQRTGRLAGQAASLGNLGLVHEALGRLEQAAGFFEQALILDRKLGFPGAEAIDLNNLGEVCHLLGRTGQARDLLFQALEIERKIGDRDTEAETLRLLADVHRDTGRDGEAREFARSALALARDTGNRRFEAEALNTLASVCGRLGLPHDAARHHEEALRIARETRARAPELTALLGLAAVRHPDDALPAAEEALALARQDGYRLLEGAALTALAGLHHLGNRDDQAVEHARPALEIHRETGHRLGEARTRLTLGHACRRLGRPDACLEHWRRARTICTEIGAPEAGEVRALLGDGQEP